MSTFTHKHTCWQSKSFFLERLILKTNETKTQDRGKGRGIFLKTQSESSNHLIHLFPLLISGRSCWVWPPFCNGKACTAAFWHHDLIQEGWLHQVVHLLLCLGHFPCHLSQHVTQGLELRLLNILPLWVQCWEIDSIFQKTSKVSDIQSSNCLSFKSCKLLQF